MAIPKTALIRELVKGDFEDVLILYKELTGGLPVLDGDAGREMFAEILNKTNMVIIGAEVEGNIVSVATLHTHHNLTFGGRPYCLIENVVTLKSHQKRGLARQVMNALIEVAWKANACRVVLLTGKSLGASGFYEKFGFSKEEKFGMLLLPPSGA